MAPFYQAHDGCVRDGKEKKSFNARGYILVDPTSEEAGSLAERNAKSLKEPGARHVVDWKFVPACIEANRILAPNDIPQGTEVFHKKGSNDGWPVLLWNKGDPSSLLRLAYKLSVRSVHVAAVKLKLTNIVSSSTARNSWRTRKMRDLLFVIQS